MSKTEVWFTEQQTPYLGITLKIRKTLHHEVTEYQEIAVHETYQFGRLLTLDGVVQTTECDEFVYHEMMVHVPILTHPRPRRVLVVGGGDGGVVRETLKHPSVEKVTMVEIDRRVIEVSKQYLPNISCGLDDPRVEIVIGDGIEFVKGVRDPYDVAIIDSTDPVGPAIGLFSEDFYASLNPALGPQGVFVAQTESPFSGLERIKAVYSSVKRQFPVARVYLIDVPTYPGGTWAITLGSKGPDPLKASLHGCYELATKYYSAEVHHRAFILPPFLKEALERCA